MREKMLILSDAVIMSLLGLRIELYNRVITSLFRKRKMISVCRLLDRRLLMLRNEFMLAEKRHLSVVCLDI